MEITETKLEQIAREQRINGGVCVFGRWDYDCRHISFKNKSMCIEGGYDSCPYYLNFLIQYSMEKKNG